MTPISRVFSTTIIEKIARMPNPATAMMKNSRMFRMLCSMATAPKSGPCFCSQVDDAEKRGMELVEGDLNLLGEPVERNAGPDLDLDLVDCSAAVGVNQLALILQAFERHINVCRIVFAHAALEVTDDRERVVPSLGLDLARPSGKSRPTFVPGGAMKWSGRFLPRWWVAIA